ncbi:rhodopsin, GQ-coupled-like [Limulus polyphemus]|uniref:Rhodopsin, GQ-coupled-like n=1 Tax=Limulus polyphemus TaxID=6850 RepID=A0ABM1SU68_LIMPO|nr:rhodopsin, GQ-coupled-like [Limulus polyphemus]
MSLCLDAEDFIRAYIGSSEEMNVSQELRDQSSVFFQSLNSSSSVYHGVFGHWCGYSAITSEIHFVVGSFLLLIGVAGIAGNGLVILVLTRYRRLRTPANRLLGNLAVSDLLMSCLHPMASFSSFRHSWQFGKLGCEFYGSMCGLFGLISITTLSAIALERCLVIAIKPWYSGLHINNSKLCKIVAFIWLYSSVCVAPPLFGWGSYIPEGFLTSCSFDYLTRTPVNRAYFVFLYILGFFLPLLVILTSYFIIWKAVFHHEQEMSQIHVNRATSRYITRRRSDCKSAEMILCIIGLFLLSWTPYAIVATIGQFWDTNVVTPWVSAIPSFFAKMSTVYNPIIYGFSHREFCACTRHLFTRTQTPALREKIYSRYSQNTPRHEKQTRLSRASGVEKLNNDVKQQPELKNKFRKCYIVMSFLQEGRSMKTVSLNQK